MSDRLERCLKQGAASLDVSLSSAEIDKLLQYLDILIKWNRVYNLTAIRDRTQMVYSHLLDSLSILKTLQALNTKPWIDVGSGAGLPGIPLAIVCPDIEITLLDSNAKKTRFLTQVAMDLALQNVQVVNQDVKQFKTQDKFGIILTRAFAHIGKMLELVGHLCQPMGYFVAMKGQFPADELTQLPEHVVVNRVEAISVPGLDATRHLVILQNQGIVST